MQTPTQNDLEQQTGGGSGAATGSAVVTYREFEAAIKRCRSNIESAPDDPPDGYDEATPESIALADASWIAGMQSLETSLLNWYQDKAEAVHNAPNWREIADDLAGALERLDALHRETEASGSPVNRPEWLRHPWQRYHRALADSSPNAEVCQPEGEKKL